LSEDGQALEFASITQEGRTMYGLADIALRGCCRAPRLLRAGVLCVGLCIACAVAAMATQVPAGPVSGMWTQAGSPYEVLGDITVPAGDHLEVQAGVAVVFQGAYRLTVQGTLAALGGAGEPVSWNGIVRWQGLRFENTSSPSTLRRCEIENAEQGVTSIDAPLDVEACLLAGHGTALHVFGVGDPDPARVRIDGCVIRDCQQHGVFIVENSNTEVTGCEITQCALDGSARGAVQLSNQSPQGSNDPLIGGNWIHHNVWQGLTAFDVTGAGRISPTVTDNTIEYNYTGVYLLYASGSFRRNQINHNFQAGNPNSGAGVMVYGATAHPVFTDNTTTGNYTGYYIIQGATANLGDLNNADPDDDGRNRICGNLDPGGHLWSVYNLSAADVMAENNIWDSDDPTVIATTIYDRHDNPASGLVDFEPVLPLAGVAPGPIGGPEAPGASVWIDAGRPNPFARTTRLAFGLAGQGRRSARLSVLDAQGRVLRRLVDGDLAPGAYVSEWDGTDARGIPAPAGVYFWRLECGGERASRPVVLRR
jgi:hypothetical protein